MFSKLHKILILALSLTFSYLALSENTIKSLGENWSEASYVLEGNKQEAAFENLVKQADRYIKENQKDAKGWIWRGIIKSSFANARGGLGALSLVKAARKDLDMAISLDENSLSGSAHASLGLLYAKVPGWPFGFGSDSEAEKHLVKALVINPNGVDPNYFYAEFLFDEKKKYMKAKEYLIKAQNSVPVQITPLADEERQKEIVALLIKIEKKINRRKRT
ncbi:MAG: hypothetical protein COB38_10480 [Gammaproteobacteria bacterium]|nr:MAG: hypothetical protein COB38_10480 [Gammaproteobacteria bacterium]